jgi:hypothetical protein
MTEATKQPDTCPRCQSTEREKRPYVTDRFTHESGEDGYTSYNCRDPWHDAGSEGSGCGKLFREYGLLDQPNPQASAEGIEERAQAALAALENARTEDRQAVMERHFARYAPDAPASGAGERLDAPDGTAHPYGEACTIDGFPCSGGHPVEAPDAPATEGARYEMAPAAFAIWPTYVGGGYVKPDDLLALLHATSGAGCCTHCVCGHPKDADDFRPGHDYYSVCGDLVREADITRACKCRKFTPEHGAPAPVREGDLRAAVARLLEEEGHKHADDCIDAECVLMEIEAALAATPATDGIGMVQGQAALDGCCMCACQCPNNSGSGMVFDGAICGPCINGAHHPV